MVWLGRYLVKRAAWLALVALVGLLVGFAGDAWAAGEPGAAPVPPLPGVPCDGPDDPPGCDPEETPTPEATPTPTPTPAATPVPVVLAAEDRDRLDLITYAVVTIGGLLVVTTTVTALATGLRRP